MTERFSAKGFASTAAALRRGEALALSGWAVFLPGEDVRCPCTTAAGRLCAGFLRDVPPYGRGYARPFVAWNGPERRTRPRPVPSTSACRQCGQKSEIEIHDTTTEEAA